MTILLRILRYMRPYWRVAALSYVCLIAVSLLTLVGPWLIGEAVDVATGEQQHFPLLPTGWSKNQTLTSAAVLLVALAVARAGINFGQRYGTQWLGRKVAYALRLDLFAHLQRLPFAYYDRTRTGQLMSRLIGDVDEIRFFAGIVIGDAINLVVLLVGIYATMFSIHAPLAALFLVPVPILFGVAYYFGVRIEPRIRAIRSVRGDMYARIQENLSQIVVVKAFAQEPYARDRFEEDNDKVLAAWLSYATLFTRAQPIIWYVVSVMTFVLLFFGGRAVLDGQLSLGTLVAFNGYVGLLTLPAHRLAYMIDVTARAVANGKRIFAIMDTTPAIKSPAGAINPGQIDGHIVFDDVSFVYDPHEDEPQVDVLYDISFEAAPDTVTAIVGTTGSGKTTLIDLIPRFYDVTSGSICIDGIDVRRLPLKLLRAQVGFVMQSTFLFNATIAENIAFGRPDATHAEIIAAAQAARAHHFILEFPDGYSTLVGERGVTLSGGQRQRIAIARALLVNPRLLILDDATASVDSRTEYEIRAALQTLMQGRTTLIVAQRLSTVRHADQILMLEAGRIVERGTHDELVRLDGRYAHLWHLQTTADAPEEDIRGIGLNDEDLPVRELPLAADDREPDKRSRTDMLHIRGDKENRS
ncbi:ABC transporter ATP-binding protein [Aggregatilinea lenta]|uniref:ABC transporter ATP-binding protein n=1 Tax=Aggregatilinea lenta TaxID=913108 RepID=UPI000E5B54E6|nr:ABC transporter ATP-binding protein [Aggregatilinea lenta]